MKSESSGGTTRQEILAAAAHVVIDSGTARLTLDTVAKRAGISKGGLLYHFPNKEALIGGLITQMLEQFDTNLADQLAADQDDKPGAWLRAYVRVSGAVAGDQIENRAALLAAIANDPNLLAPVDEAFARYQRESDNAGIDPAAATIIRLATDGLWFAELFGISPPKGKLRDAVLARLIELSRVEEKP